MTSNEKETNLCETCGRKLFDVSFEDQEKMLQEQARIREQKIRINTVFKQVDDIKARIKRLKQEPKEANWLYRVLTNFRRTCPMDLLAALKDEGRACPTRCHKAVLARGCGDVKCR